MGPDALADEELLERIGARSAAAREAESALCARYAPRIRLYGLKHLRDRALAEDLVQLVLLRTLEAARDGAVQQRDRLDRFVLGTCRLTAQRLRQRGQREQPSPDGRVGDELAVEPFALVDTQPLLKCLDALEPRARLVVMLSFHEDRSADEIAAELAITAGNVRVVRHRALLALRQCLDGSVDVAQERPT